MVRYVPDYMRSDHPQERVSHGKRLVETPDSGASVQLDLPMLGKTLIETNHADIGCDPRILQSDDTTALYIRPSQKLIGGAVKSKPKDGAWVKGMTRVEANARLAEFRIDRVDEPAKLDGKQGLTERRGDKLHYAETWFVDHVAALTNNGSLQHWFRRVAIEGGAARGREEGGGVCVEQRIRRNGGPFGQDNSWCIQQQ